MAKTQDIILTGELNRLVSIIEGAVDDVWKLAFMETYNNNIDLALRMLRVDTRKAIVATKEYKYADFAVPLLEAVYKEESLQFTPSSDFTRIIVNVTLNRTAGTLEEYAQAVNEARGILNAKKAKNQKGADFWASIYDAARTPTGRITKRKQGAKESFLNLLYERTISVRKSFFSQERKAPYWSLLDLGNIGTMGGNSSFAHPTVAPTHFTSIAKNRIENLFNDIYTQKLRVLNRRFVEESVEAQNLSNYVNEIISGITPKKIKEGAIFGEIRVGEREYQIYATRIFHHDRIDAIEVTAKQIG